MCSDDPNKLRQQEKNLPDDITRSLGEVRDVLHLRSLSSYIDEDYSRTIPVIGLCSTTVRTGDMLCLLGGCSVPVILRSEDDGNYRLISDAYETGQFRVKSTGGEEGVNFEHLDIDMDSLDTFCII
jgi:hypothetical protein